VIVLREAKQVKFGAFMTPGRQLQVSVELTQLQDSLATFRARGRNDAGEQTVFAQLTLFGYSLAQHTPTGAEQDALLRDYWQKRWLALTGQWWGPIPSPTHARSAAN